MTEDGRGGGDTRWRVAAAVFILACGAALAGVREFTGWGDGGEAAHGALSLRPTSLPGCPLYLQLARLSGFLPVNSPVFGVNVLSAVSCAAGAALIFAALVRRGLAARLALTPVLLVFTVPRFWEISADAGVEAFVFMLFAAAMCRAGDSSPRGHLFSALFVLLCAGIHAAPALFALTLALFDLPQPARRTGAAANRAAALIILLSAVACAALIFTALRPPAPLRWDTPLSAAVVTSEPGALREAPELLASPAALKKFIFGFADDAAGVYIPVMILLPFILLARPVPLPALTAVAFVPVLAVLLALSPHRDAGLWLLMTWTLVFTAGAFGADCLHKTLTSSARRPARLIRAAPHLLWAAAVLVPFTFPLERPAPLVLRASDQSGRYAREVLTSLPRDSILFAVSEADPLVVLGAAHRLERIRPDVKLLYPLSFPRKGYRASVRREYGEEVVFPSESDYGALIEQVLSGIVGGEAPHPAVKKRAGETAQLILTEMIAVKNGRTLPVYFTSVAQFTTSGQLGRASFMPERLAFRLQTGEPAVFDVGETLAPGAGALVADPRAASVVAVYFTDIGENFYRNRETFRAEEFLSRASALDPRSARSHFLLGLVYRAEGRYGDATGEFVKALTALKSEEGVPDAMRTTRTFMLARIYQELGELRAADTYLKELEGE
ncbi:MAG: hypothetical protein AB1742_07890 [bacterium]